MLSGKFKVRLYSLNKKSGIENVAKFITKLFADSEF